MLLEGALPVGDLFMHWLSSWPEVVRGIVSLFVYIDVYVWHPRLIVGYTLLSLNLRVPGPIAIEIEVIMIGASAGPGLAVLSRLRIGVH